MADKNMEDSDIEPAPKLIEVVFLNCRGLVDHWVEPYLRITVERLHRTGKSNLKCLLMQVVRVSRIFFIDMPNEIVDFCCFLSYNVFLYMFKKAGFL